MRILNLYAGLGGNRTLWPDEHEVTAVEFDEQIAQVYADRFPDDRLVIGDAHAFLLDYHDYFDFIWSSPPCQSHSRIRHERAVPFLGSKPIYPDMRLYEEILFLSEYFAGKYVVENVLPWYGALIPAQKINRHLYWANFDIPPMPPSHENLRAIQIPALQQMHGIDLTGYRMKDKRQALRNMVPAEVGLHVLKAALATVGQ